MQNNHLKWIYLISLALIWGSSFILIKLALEGLNPVQVGAFRIIIAAVVLIIVGYKSVRGLSKKQWFYIGVNAFLGTFFPAFLFAYAIDKIDSSIAAILNSLTPLNTLIFGILLFGYSFKRKQVLGIVIGFIGTVMLIISSHAINYDQKLLYMCFILLATVGYAINVNIIKKHLNEVKALGITTGNFIILVIPTLLVIYYQQIENPVTWNDTTQNSIIYLLILAVFGTALAKTFFNKLVQISTTIFSASVTYLIPVVAVCWGVYFGEKLSFLQLISGCIILFGVYLVNRSK